MSINLLKKLPVIKNCLLKIKALETETEMLRQKCLDLEVKLSQCDYLPVPPLALRVRVGGWEETDHFLGVGRKIGWDLNKLLKGIDKNLNSFNNILDFGCGCGRVLRFLKPIEGQTIKGSDIDSESITWCQQNLGTIATFKVNHDLPPLPYPDASFDFIYSISVFTHLPEDMQFQWLEELNRVLKVGGFLITTAHGEALIPVGLPAEIFAQFKQQGFYYLKGGGTNGLPDYYQTAFHSHAYIQKYWSRYFKIVTIQTRGINNHQDAVICQKIGK